MDVPVLFVLLALPFAAAVAIVAVSLVRRRGRPTLDGPGGESVHRLQAETAAVQDATVHPPRVTGHAVSGRERRAASGDGKTSLPE